MQIKISTLFILLLTGIFSREVLAYTNMTNDDLIKFADVFVGTLDADDLTLVETLEKRGVSRYTSERYVAFMPIAFGRVVISNIAQVTFSDKYSLRESIEPIEYSLSNEPLYINAFKMAEESYKGNVLSGELFNAIALRSAELSSVSKALNAKVDINGGVFQPVLLWGYKTLGK